jgi:hypothetical protein
MNNRAVGLAIAIALGSAPLATAGAQRVTPRDTDSIIVARAAGRNDSSSRGEVTSIEYRKAWLRIDSLVARSAAVAPNAGGGVGFTHGAITPGVGMTGSNQGGNNSNGRTATPAQGSSASPSP